MIPIRYTSEDSTRCFEAFMCTNAFFSNLDGKALAEWASQRLAAGDFIDEQSKERLAQAIRDGQQQSRSLFDEVLDILRWHGVKIEA